MVQINDAVIETIQLSKVFRDFWGRPKVRALEDLSFHVRRGEIFGLLGPNGAGKSTTIKMLLGFLFPTRGKIAILGGSPRNVRNKARIGFLPEESYLYPYQNAEEALMFYGKLFKLAHKTCRQRVADLLEMVGLTRARKRPLKEYSKGMARRIGIAQALINDPDLVILDEPTSGLDPIGAREIKDLVLQLKQHGKTVLLSSHLLADVEDVCDRVCILYGGRKSCEGEISQLLKNRDTSQIISAKLSAEQERMLREWFVAQGVALHEIGHPSEKLEKLFLETVEKARQQQPETSGAEEGKRLEHFFSQASTDQEKSGQQILDKLIHKEERKDPVVTEQATTAQPDRELLETLTTAPAEERKEAALPAEKDEQSQIDEDMLSKLIRREGQGDD